jgi:transcriptional antiterminator RfaH
VTRVVQFGDRPSPIDDSIMAELRALVQDNETVEVSSEPQPGSEVIVTGGAMQGLRVLVTRVIPARQRVAILLELLGTAREVEIERDRVFPVNPRVGKG